MEQSSKSDLHQNFVQEPFLILVNNPKTPHFPGALPHKPPPGAYRCSTYCLQQCEKCLQHFTNMSSARSKVPFISLPDATLFSRIGPICFNESPLKIMKNAFDFILKALFILKIFNFLS